MTHSYVWHDSFICVTWLIHMCDMTHSYVWHDSFICVTWSIHMCDMTHSYVWHDPFICVTWSIHMCDMTHSYVWHGSFICVTVMSHIWTGLYSRPTTNKCNHDLHPLPHQRYLSLILLHTYTYTFTYTCILSFLFFLISTVIPSQHQPTWSWTPRTLALLFTHPCTYLYIHIYKYIFSFFPFFFSSPLIPTNTSRIPTTKIFNPFHISITFRSSFYIHLHTYLQICVFFFHFFFQPTSDSKPTPTKHQPNSTLHQSVVLFTHPCTYIYIHMYKYAYSFGLFLRTHL